MTRTINSIVQPGIGMASGFRAGYMRRRAIAWQLLSLCRALCTGRRLGRLFIAVPFFWLALQSAYSAAATTTLNPTADAYVRDGTWANSNNGTSAGLFTQTRTKTGNNYDSYLKFDLSGVGSIAAAKFRISASVSGGTGVGMTVYSVADTTWVETSITWNNKPPRGGALSSTTVTGNTFVYYEFDVSSYVIAEKAAGRNLVSFALHNPAESSQAIWMHSRETTSGSPPQLVITPNVAPTVSLTSPANGATFTAPATIPLAATAADADGTIAKVEFFHGDTNLIATVTTAPYTFNWTNVAAASYTLTAKATDNLNATTTSALVNVTVNPGVAQLFFIHTDHLNTPRVITNQAAQVVWRWDQSDPFGGNPPDENPSGLGNFTCNLRLPGQYFDQETNTHYNYFRDYDPAIGRYTQFDPIGLLGGINGYAYVENQPLLRVDPLGLQSSDIFGGRPKPAPVGWPNVSTQAQQSLAGQLQRILNNVISPSSDELERCYQRCEEQRKRDQDDCEWWWKMRGRNADDYRRCQRAADERLLKCYEECKKSCEKK